MNRIRFNIQQLLLLMVLAALAIKFYAERNSEPLVWRTSLLSYTIPAVPGSFTNNGRSAPKYNFGKKFEYESGPEMYLTMHRLGWESARMAFFENTKNSLKKYPHINPADDTKWTVDHWHAGCDEGATICADQIIQLASQSGENSLRSKLAYSRKWHTIPLAILMSLVVFLIIIVGLRENRRIANRDLTSRACEPTVKSSVQRAR